jgi:hypothetical protein
VESEAVKPAFIVFEGGDYIGPFEFFGVVSVSAFQTCLDECSFRFGEERGRGWVIVNKEVSANGNDDS